MFSSSVGATCYSAIKHFQAAPMELASHNDVFFYKQVAPTELKAGIGISSEVRDLTR